jgi:quinol monooxygenase YgiN
MNSMSAVAIFPDIKAENLAEFKELAGKMLKVISEQSTITRYDMFFNADSTKCVVLEEYSEPQGVIDHVNKNAEILSRLVELGGAIDGSVFPMNQSGAAMEEIRSGWDTKIHTFYAGKNR